MTFERGVGMNEMRSNWQSKELARVFSEGVRGAIPGANLQLDVICKIVRAWFPTPSTMLDLGCGDGILGRTLLDEYPTVNMTFADFSEPMLEKLRNKVGTDKQANIINSDFSSWSWMKGIESKEPFDVIVSGFAIHHQTDGRKKELYAEIYRLLSRGGIFLNLDQVSSATPSISGIFDSYFLDHMRRYHTNAGQEESMNAIEEAYYQDKKENIPAPVETQCKWLRQIGFQDVDCFFRTFELALFGGRKLTSEDIYQDQTGMHR